MCWSTPPEPSMSSSRSVGVAGCGAFLRCTSRLLNPRRSVRSISESPAKESHRPREARVRDDDGDGGGGLPWKVGPGRPRGRHRSWRRRRAGRRFSSRSSSRSTTTGACTRRSDTAAPPSAAARSRRSSRARLRAALSARSRWRLVRGVSGLDGAIADQCGSASRLTPRRRPTVTPRRC